MVQATSLITLLIVTFLGWASLVVVLHKLSPFSAAPFSLIMFYGSLFLATAGTLSLVNLGLRSLLTHKNPGRRLGTAVRQGSLLAIVVTVAMGFQRLKVLTWWDALLLVVIVLLVEFYFMAND